MEILKKFKNQIIFALFSIAIIGAIGYEFGTVSPTMLSRIPFSGISWDSKVSTQQFLASTVYKQAKIRVGFCEPAGYQKNLNYGYVTSLDSVDDICIETENVTGSPVHATMYFLDGVAHPFDPTLPSCEDEKSRIDDFAQDAFFVTNTGAEVPKIEFIIPPESKVEKHAKINKFTSSHKGFNYGCLITLSGDQAYEEGKANLFIRRGNTITTFLTDGIEITNNGTTATKPESVKFNDIQVAVTGTGNAFSGAYILYGADENNLNKRVDLNGSKDNLFASEVGLTPGSLYYYEIWAFSTFNGYAVSDVLKFRTPSPSTTEPGTGGAPGGGGGGGSVSCINVYHIMSSTAQTNGLRNVTRLNLKESNGVVTRPVVMEDCYTRYKLFIEPGTQITYPNGEPFTGTLKSPEKMATKLLPDPGSNTKIIKGVSVGDIDGEILHFSKPFLLYTPLTSGEVLMNEYDLIDGYFVNKDGEYELAGNGGKPTTSKNAFNNTGSVLGIQYSIMYGDISDKETDTSDEEELHGTAEDITCGEKAGEMVFEDIKGHWGEGYIKRIFDLGIVHGKTKYSFAPDDLVSRAELTKMAVNGLCIKLPTVTEKPFLDVEVNDWYAKFVLAAKNVGMMVGYGDGTTRPNLEITRAEAIKLYLRAFGFDGKTSAKSKFSDIYKNDWFYPYVAQSEKLDIIKGYTERVRPYKIEIKGSGLTESFEVSQYLIPGSQNEEIKELQKILKKLGYFAYEPSGYFGHITQESIKRLQQDHGTITYEASSRPGYFGPKTVVKIDHNQLLQIGAFSGDDKMTHQVFRPHQALTRAEAAKILNVLIDLKVQEHMTDFTIINNTTPDVHFGPNSVPKQYQKYLEQSF